MLSSVDCITATSESEFLVHTAGGGSESRSRSHALHASLTVIAMHIDGIASFITLPVAMVLVVTLVLLIATAVLVTLALRRDGD
jgi:hypothetical protein